MTTRISIVLAVMIIALFVADHYLLHWDLPVFLGRKFSNLLDYVAFWR